MKAPGMFRDAELKQIAAEASRALALLDAERLDELARACHALTRNSIQVSGPAAVALATEAREAAGEMAVFARVLDATRANLSVMARLRELQQGRLNYAETGQPWALPEKLHGND